MRIKAAAAALALALLLAQTSCKKKPKPAEPTPAPASASGQTDVNEQPPSERPAPVIVFVGEMKPFAEKLAEPVDALPGEVVTSFAADWERVRPSVAEEVNAESLLGISNWAKEQMKGFAPPEGWIESIPMHPSKTSRDGRRILFTQETEEGFALPSHSPIVFRRIVLGAVYDRQSHIVTTVYVTIRGWIEE